MRTISAAVRAMSRAPRQVEILELPEVWPSPRGSESDFEFAGEAIPASPSVADASPSPCNCTLSPSELEGEEDLDSDMAEEMPKTGASSRRTAPTLECSDALSRFHVHFRALALNGIALPISATLSEVFAHGDTLLMEAAYRDTRGILAVGARVTVERRGEPFVAHVCISPGVVRAAALAMRVGTVLLPSDMGRAGLRSQVWNSSPSTLCRCQG